METHYDNASFVGTDEVRNGAAMKALGVQRFDPSKGNGKTVVLLGSGDMTMGLAINLLRAKLHPVVASRNPERARNRLKKMKNLEVDVASIQDGLVMGEIVIVAIPSDHHKSLPSELLRDKIVIDISNRSAKSPAGGPSIAEKLQEILPESQVVKAFNTLSSYALSQGDIRGSREVPICGDSEEARAIVASLVREIGLVPVDQGALRNARSVEDIPLSFFPEWKGAGILAICLFIFYFLIVLFEQQLCLNIDNKTSNKWELQPFQHLPLLNVQHSLSYAAGTLLLVTYLPGAFAAYIQMFRGTKYSPFPNWLDKWMKSRKQFGLLALLLGATHGGGAIFTQMTWGMTRPESWHEQLYCMLDIRGVMSANSAGEDSSSAALCRSLSYEDPKRIRKITNESFSSVREYASTSIITHDSF